MFTVNLTVHNWQPKSPVKYCKIYTNFFIVCTLRISSKIWTVFVKLKEIHDKTSTFLSFVRVSKSFNVPLLDILDINDIWKVFFFLLFSLSCIFQVFQQQSWLFGFLSGISMITGGKFGLVTRQFSTSISLVFAVCVE